MPDTPDDGDALHAFVDRIELAFQSTSIEHATAIGESSEETVRRLRSAVGEAQHAISTAAEALVERLEAAASVQTVGAEALAERLHTDVDAAREHLRGALRDGAAQVQEAMAQAVQDAAARLQAQVSEIARQVIPEAATATAEQVSGHTEELTAQLRTAVAQAQQRLGEATESAVTRLEQAAATVEQGGAAAATAVVGTTEEQAEQLRAAVADVVSLMQQLTASAADVDARLVGGVERIETATAGATATLERFGEAALARVVGDVGELMARLQQGTESSRERLIEVADRAASQLGERLDAAADRMGSDSRETIGLLTEAVRLAVVEVGERAAGVGDVAARDAATHSGRLADAADDLTRTVAAVIARIDARTDSVAGAARLVGDASGTATGAVERLEAVASRFTAHTEQSLGRTTEVADTMVTRFAELMDAAVRASSEATAGNIETLTTTVAWANKTLQGLLERMVDDLATSAATATKRIDTAGEVALGRMVDLVEDLEVRLLEEVGRAVAPLSTETLRVAEQQATLAETVADVETLMGRRDAEASRRDAVAERMEEAVVTAAELVAEGTRQLREEQVSAAAATMDVVRGLGESSDLAASLMADLTAVTERLEAATAAADTSRQALERLVARAEELAEDAAARRRRAPAVPPPTSPRPG